MPNTISELHLGRVLNPLSNGSIDSFDKGCLAITVQGKVGALGDATELRAAHPDAVIHDHGDALITPGFIDTHVHLAQVYARGYVAGGLLQWLDEAIYPAEMCFADPKHAEAAAHAYAQDCIRNGITTSAVFLTSHPEASQRCFEVINASGLSAVMGMVQMEHGAPDELCLSPSESLAATEKLISTWHGFDEGRIRYALTPRFALSCSGDFLKELGKLRAQDPSLFVHTHISESTNECAQVTATFPESKNYLDVYKSNGLVGPHTILAHGIHMSDQELEEISSCRAGVSHCPSSNLFLKSGTFPWARYVEKDVAFGLGSDVGAGPSMNLFSVMRDAYMIQPELFLHPRELLWRATLGGAQALGLDAETGSFAPGKHADFLVLNPNEHPSISESQGTDDSLDKTLSFLVFLGDDRCVSSTYVRGQKLG